MARWAAGVVVEGHQARAPARPARDQLRLDGSIELLVPSQIDGCRLPSWRR
jgi:hypothetical protein